MIKLIASDLDGTLIPEGTQEIEPGFFEVLSELLDQGYQFYVATGRQYANVRRLFPIMRTASDLSARTVPLPWNGSVSSIFWKCRGKRQLRLQRTL